MEEEEESQTTVDCILDAFIFLFLSFHNSFLENVDISEDYSI